MSGINGSCSSTATQIFQQGLQQSQAERALQNDNQPKHLAVIEPASSPVVEANKGVYIDIYV